MPKKEDEKRPAPLIDEEVEDGTYSNATQVLVSPAEVVIDFGRIVPGRRQVKTLSRIILTPAHAKQLAAILADNMRKYEDQYGELKQPGRGPDIDVPEGGFPQ